MKTRLLLIVAALVVTSGIAFAATFTYKCQKCSLIQQFSFAGIHKCPNDGSLMFLQP